MPSFDLVREPWVPVTVDGQRIVVSLLDSLTRAHEIDGLALDDPLEAVSVLRQVLLPVVLDAEGAPRSEADWEERFNSPVAGAHQRANYLARHASRFDLFHPAQPFGQVAGLRTANDETRPVSVLIASTATGQNVPLFSARTEADPPALAPADAATALLAAHCWDVAGIKSGAVGDLTVKGGKGYGSPTGPLGALGVVVPIGRTLAETLTLNTPIIRSGLSPDDRPQWRADPATSAWSQRQAVGLLDLLTWQARRIRLVSENAGDGRVVVRRVVLALGDRLEFTPLNEPHTAWRRVDRPKAGMPPQRPIRHVAGRAAWRGLEPLLATQTTDDAPVSSTALIGQLADQRAQGRVPEDLPLQVLTVGLTYGTQSAVVDDAIADIIPLPLAALPQESDVRDLLDRVVRHAEELRRAANLLHDDLRRAAGGDKQPFDRGEHLGDVLIHRLGTVVRRMLAGLQNDSDHDDAAETAWRATARRLALEAAEPMLAAMPPTSFLGRSDKRGSHRLSAAEGRYRRAVTSILGHSSSDPGPRPALDNATDEPKTRQESLT
jgi:CRISPR system Cascade subunit CasA